MQYIVYKITNKINNKIYIGQTTETLQRRFYRHCGYQLNDNTYLHRAMKKYGIQNFTIEQIDEANSQDELNELEYYWITKYNACDSNIGYNTKNVKGKCGRNTLTNHPNKKEISKKISKSKQGAKNPNAVKVKAINILTHDEMVFNSMIECCKMFNLKEHTPISRRCRHIIKKPLNNIWLFEYAD